ncbi:MAG: hypothetical protein ABGY75_00765, partial [Gemmataceae bacterium]
VTIMNYPPDLRYRRMCYAFLDTVIANGAASVTILYEDHPPAVSAEHRRRADVEVVRCRSHDVGHPHFNLRFKLANLAALDFPFLFLDADTVTLSDLRPLWALLHDKPWVGVNHQWVPADPRTHRSPFLNSGVQLVGDPSFYDLRAILAVQEEAAPLRRAAEFGKEEMFACPGADQAVLFRYFSTIGYDYTHPQVGHGWNSCAGVTTIARDAAGRWAGLTTGLPDVYPVHVNHYWSQFKPWAIGCPVYDSYAWVDEG